MTEFKITGPGLYKTREGEKALVKERIENNFNGVNYCWKGNINGNGSSWNDFGIYCVGGTGEQDIIGPWEEPSTVSSVLTYAGVTKKPSDTVTWLEFVQVMQQLDSPASTFSSSPKAEKQSEDEAESNEACDEAGDALKTAIIQGKCVVAATKGICSLEEETEIVKRKLEAQGYTIVRLKDTRNGCYNTRTEKDTD